MSHFLGPYNAFVDALHERKDLSWDYVSVVRGPNFRGSDPVLFEYAGMEWRGSVELVSIHSTKRLRLVVPTDGVVLIPADQYTPQLRGLVKWDEVADSTGEHGLDPIYSLISEWFPEKSIFNTVFCADIQRLEIRATTKRQPHAVELTVSFEQGYPEPVHDFSNCKPLRSTKGRGETKRDNVDC